jgi:HPt (histidine-containing phosphotransfer) domain-containing protein
MTAHAMKGDRERCLAAGMDGYVAKPIRSLELEKSIAEVLGKARPDSEHGVRENEFAIDSQALLEGVGGDRRLLQKLARLFLADLPRFTARIKTALDSGDTVELAKVAHALKGSVGNFGAAKVVEVASEMERLGRAEEIAAARNRWAALELELEVVRQGLTKLAASDTKRRAKEQQK